MSDALPIALGSADAAAALALARQCVQQREPAWVVRVTEARGSVPRETDAWMLVTAKQSAGTIGGGHLELLAVQVALHQLQDTMQAAAAGSAEALLPAAIEPFTRSWALGPGLGQCCGGHVALRFEPLTPQTLAVLELQHTPRPTVLVCGAGHVGRALVQILATLPVQVVWADPRPELLSPEWIPLGVQTDDDPLAALAALPPGSHVRVLTHSHALDFELMSLAARQADRLASWGVIGSNSKGVGFRRRLQSRGVATEVVDRMLCPLGNLLTTGKQPGVIALSIASELLMNLQASQAEECPLNRPAELPVTQTPELLSNPPGVAQPAGANPLTARRSQA